MNLISVNVGEPAPVAWQGRTVLTAIFKKPVACPVSVHRLGLEGDAVADPEVHGGEHKAVYAFPFEHYDYFAQFLGRNDFVHGQFGENLTTSGLLETEVCIGDRLRIGGVLLEVTQPREPCFKLGIRMNDSRILRQLLESRRTGFYLRVVQEGVLVAGMEVTHEPAEAESLTVSEITRVCYFDKDDLPTVRRAAGLERLTPSWRENFRQRIGAA
ncbi:MAG TPA: MOSC domain-containing protein [Verrucomicrobiales bacterium]|nr:MOSC domain-containing protein [Verrucomicrobiales bacterium]